jgi:uncharacterized membrane protein
MRKISVSPLVVWTPDLYEIIEKEKEKLPFLEMKTVVSKEQENESKEKHGIDNIVKAIFLMRIMLDLVYTVIGLSSVKKLITSYRDNGKVTASMIMTIAGMVFSIRSIINNFSALKDAMFTLWNIKGMVAKEIRDLSGAEWEQLKYEIAAIFGGG